MTEFEALRLAMHELLNGYVPSCRPAKPGRVIKLNPAFERLVRGPVRRPRAIAEIEKVAEMTWCRETSPIPEIDAAIRRAAVRVTT